MKNAKHFVAVAILVVLTTLLLRIVLNWMFQIPLAASSEAIPIDTMTSVHFWMIALLFSLIMVLMIYSVVVFRRKEGDEEDAEYVHSNTALEIGWTVIPTFVVIGFGIYGAVTLEQITSPKPLEMAVVVNARQWVWSFEYPEEGDFTSAELVLPVDQPIVLEMYSQDVLHSFWVPEFRVKQDLVPDSREVLRLTPSVIGEYDLLCAEICGQDHTEMVAPVRVLAREDYDAWVEEKLSQPRYADMTPEERGALFHSAEGLGCIGCHSVDGTPGAGPTWLGIWGRQEALNDGTSVTVDIEYVHDSIMNPNEDIVEGFQPSIMPGDYQERISQLEADILASEGTEIDVVADLIAFMQTLEE